MAELLADVGQTIAAASQVADMPHKEALQEQKGSEAILPISTEDAQPSPSLPETTEGKRQRTDDSAGLLPNGLPTAPESSKDADPSAPVVEGLQAANGVAKEVAKQEITPQKQSSKLSDGPSTSDQSGPVSFKQNLRCMQKCKSINCKRLGSVLGIMYCLVPI